MAECARKLTTTELARLAEAVHFLARNVRGSLRGQLPSVDRAMLDVVKLVPWPTSATSPPDQARLCEAARIAYDGYVTARRLEATLPVDQQIVSTAEVAAQATTVAVAIAAIDVVGPAAPPARPASLRTGAGWAFGWAAVLTVAVGGAAWALTRVR